MQLAAVALALKGERERAGRQASRQADRQAGTAQGAKAEFTKSVNAAVINVHPHMAHDATSTRNEQVLVALMTPAYSVMASSGDDARASANKPPTPPPHTLSSTAVWVKLVACGL